jgi:hypothetical protein
MLECGTGWSAVLELGFDPDKKRMTVTSAECIDSLFRAMKGAFSCGPQPAFRAIKGTFGCEPQPA